MSWRQRGWFQTLGKALLSVEWLSLWFHWYSKVMRVSHSITWNHFHIITSYGINNSIVAAQESYRIKQSSTYVWYQLTGTVHTQWLFQLLTLTIVILHEPEFNHYLQYSWTSMYIGRHISRNGRDNMQNGVISHHQATRWERNPYSMARV